MSATLTQYGPGDAATWGAPTGHPHDPRTPDEDGADDTMLLQIWRGVRAMVHYVAADDGRFVDITGVTFSGGAFLDSGAFAADVLDDWAAEIQAQLREERDMAADCAAIDRLEDDNDH